MAKFEIAEAITGRNEGGYANNPADTGGETYAGIARNFWPKWSGWLEIDMFKKAYVKNTKESLTAFINRNGKNNLPLIVKVSNFYKQNFWDAMSLDLVLDQQLANTVYDFGVNSGVGRAAKVLQQSVNEICNVNLTVDGKIGSKTIAEINKHNAEFLYNEFNKQREAFYRSIAKGSQVQFLRSWLSRLKPYQN